MTEAREWGMPPLSRRTLLWQMTALGLAPLAAPLRAAKPKTSLDPFSLGVASGAPTRDGFVLWTRLAPRPAEPGGGLDPVPLAVRWEVASDERFTKIEAKGTAFAVPGEAHSVHVEVDRLASARGYFYRFLHGDAVSPVGRTRTAPGANDPLARLRFGVASCQHYEQGFFGALRHAAESDLDLFVHLGDYIYESSWGARRDRRHAAPEPYSVDDYRIRHALYKSDAGLRAAHAAMPWLFTWDDHEVDNDYAGARSEWKEPEAWFVERRMNAYRAWWEHLPVRRTSYPLGGHAKIFGRHAFGTLATFHVLDDRQYRDPHPCPRTGRGGSRMIASKDCADLGDESRSLLGEPQESWLLDGLTQSRARWNLLAQQTLVAPFDRDYRKGNEQIWTDGWDGYPAARARLLSHLGTAKPRNPLFLGGDVHSFWATELSTNSWDAKAPAVATELVAGSVTAESGFPAGMAASALASHPHVKFCDGDRNGYLRVDLTPERAEARFLAVVDKFDAATKVETLGAFAIADGRAALEKI